MKKRAIYIITVLMLLNCLTVFVVKTVAEAGPQRAWVPYNIKSGVWWTGLHIETNYLNETLTVVFFDGSDEYAVETIELPEAVWTDAAENLLTNPAEFRSPSLLLFYSEYDYFTVTQFVGNDIGFGFQTFFSWPYSDTADWINGNSD